MLPIAAYALGHFPHLCKVVHFNQQLRAIMRVMKLWSCLYENVLTALWLTSKCSGLVALHRGLDRLDGVAQTVWPPRIEALSGKAACDPKQPLAV